MLAHPAMMTARRSIVAHPLGNLEQRLFGNARLLLRQLEGTRAEMALAFFRLLSAQKQTPRASRGVCLEPPSVRFHTVCEGRLLSLRVLLTQSRRHAVHVRLLPWPVGADGAAPAVAPAVVGALAVEGVGLFVQHIHLHLAVPVAGGARWWGEGRGLGWQRLWRRGYRAGRFGAGLGRWARRRDGRAGRRRRWPVDRTSAQAQYQAEQGDTCECGHGVSSNYLSGLSMVSCCNAVVELARGWLRPIHSPAVG